MPGRPITRYYNFGLTFRWARGDTFVVVKSGYVIEGKHIIAVRNQAALQVTNHPKETAGEDRHTWVATFPIASGDWDKPDALAIAATEWARDHEEIANWPNLAQLPPTPAGERT